MTDVARNCTRHAFTDGRCRERPDGCRDCPAEFYLPPLNPSPKHSLIEILNIALNAAALIVVLCLWIYIW